MKFKSINSTNNIVINNLQNHQQYTQVRVLHAPIFYLLLLTFRQDLYLDNYKTDTIMYDYE